MAAVDLDWECKGKLTTAQWACDTAGHLGGDAMQRQAHDQGGDLTSEVTEQVIHECETSTMTKQVSWVKPLCCGEQCWERQHGIIFLSEYNPQFEWHFLAAGQSAISRIY